jgi:hypothetical protein
MDGTGVEQAGVGERAQVQRHRVTSGIARAIAPADCSRSHTSLRISRRLGEATACSRSTRLALVKTKMISQAELLRSDPIVVL